MSITFGDITKTLDSFRTPAGEFRVVQSRLAERSFVGLVQVDPEGSPIRGLVFAPSEIPRLMEILATAHNYMSPSAHAGPYDQKLF